MPYILVNALHWATSNNWSKQAQPVNDKFLADSCGCLIKFFMTGIYTHCRQYMNTHCWLSITKEVKGCVQQTYISEIAHPTGSSSVNYSFPCTHQLCSFPINKGVLRHEKYAHHALIPRFLPSLCHIYDWCTHFTELAMEARQCSLWTLNSWQMLVGLWSSLLWRGEGEIEDQQEKEHSKRDKHSFSVLFSQLLQFFFCGVCM